jgi:hypothetical protein
MKKENPRPFDFFVKKIDGYLLPNEIKSFVLKKYRIINQGDLSGESDQEEIIRINENLNALGWIRVKTTNRIANLSNHEEALAEATKWVDTLKNGKVIQNDFISDQAGFFLDILDDRCGKENSFFADSIESLLKYVEVYRKKILANILRSGNTENNYLKWISVSILFSRTSRRHNDLRFLNAALKLDDMFFPKMKNQNKDKSLLNYLIALTEQELSAMELLQ